ncbi:flagellar hook-basal body complex protein [Gemmobacter serpentinus]|uniref:flagellar hook-basal body complex protein n=1 Tax=Gemmobacter serpentinus TaxID=2652247 RepID=UPI00124E94CA|nr:flagellar hook-basal body complex protein [Gemmobacter serpentinus]
MDSTAYTTLTRQSGLMRELQAIANNIANASTTGFRREGVIFSEFVHRMQGAPSLSMARAAGRNIDLTPADFSMTGGSFDFAIEGEGFFLIDTPAGNRLTRAGSFTQSATGELVNPDGYRLLDAGGAPIFVPSDAGMIALSPDGTLSANGAPLAQLGLWMPEDPDTLIHEGGTLFAALSGEVPQAEGRILQGQLEGSNVNPVIEVSRMIDVQRSYELGQSFLDREDERLRGVIQTLGR